MHIQCVCDYSNVTIPAQALCTHNYCHELSECNCSQEVCSIFLMHVMNVYTCTPTYLLGEAGSPGVSVCGSVCPLLVQPQHLGECQALVGTHTLGHKHT